MTLSGLETFDFIAPREAHIMSDGRGVLEPRTGLAIAILFAIVIVSGTLIFYQGAITSEVWGLLLAVPLTILVAVSLSRTSRTSNPVGSSEDWDDEGSEWDGNEVGDPEESGFDVPVL